MQNRDEQKSNEQDLSKLANSGRGPQGVDKAPGEEPSADTVQFTQETQKGKTVDADQTEENGRPIEQDKDL